MKHPRHAPPPAQSSMSGPGWLLLIARSLAVSVEVFLHRPSTFGIRYFGAQAAVAALVIFVFPTLSRVWDPTPMMVFLCGYLLLLACARAGAMRRVARGTSHDVHSFYTGTPRFPRLIRTMGEQRVKAVVEPALVWVVGILLMEPAPALGTYLLVAGAGLLVSVNLSLHAERRRALDMNDAFLEQQRQIEEWRRMRGQ